jgi:hypothetical protein
LGAYSYRWVYGLYCGRSVAAAKLGRHRKSAIANPRMHGTRFIRFTHHLTWWSPVTPASRGQTQFFRSELITGRLARTIADAEVAGARPLAPLRPVPHAPSREFGTRSRAET